MRQAARAALALVTVLVPLVLLMPRLGQLVQVPAAPFPLAFTLCAGQPCYGGIAPGVYTWEQSAQVAESLAPGATITIEPERIALFYDGGNLLFFRSADGIHVGRTFVNVTSGRMPVGWLVAAWGEPCGTSYYAPFQYLVVRYPFALINIQLEASGFSPYTPIVSATFQDPDVRFDVQPDLCVDNVTDGAENQPWRGWRLR